jgi:hypothetical protein
MWTIHSPLKFSTEIFTMNRLLRDEGGKVVDSTKYRQMIGCLMHLLATIYDLTFSVCLIARYMESPTENRLVVVKRIIRYLKGAVMMSYKDGLILIMHVI